MRRALCVFALSAVPTVGIVGAAPSTWSGVAGASPPAAMTPDEALLATLADPNGVSVDEFGYSVGISGDTAVVGTPRAGCRNTCPGAAYVYTKGNAGWPTTPTVTLNGPADAVSDESGTSVAISGTTIIVGATDKAYVYVEGSAGWPTTPTATLADPVPNVSSYELNYFGQSVAISGKTAIVGAPGTSPDGAAYVYLDGPSGWPTVPTTTLQESGKKVRGGFGYSVSVAGSTAFVGAPAGINFGGPGATYAFAKTPNGWPSLPSAILRDPAANDADAFGSAVSVWGQIAAIGADRADDDGGLAYLYVEGSSGWSSARSVTLHSPGAEGFGESVAVSGSSAVVGGTFSGDAFGGGAYLYVEKSSGFSPTPTFTFQNPVQQPAESYFGSSVAVSGHTVVVGDDGLNGQAGGGYLFGP